MSALQVSYLILMRSETKPILETFDPYLYVNTGLSVRATSNFHIKNIKIEPKNFRTVSFPA